MQCIFPATGKKIFSSLNSGECGGALKDYSIQESASYRKYLSNQWETDENVPSNWNYDIVMAVYGYQLASFKVEVENNSRKHRCSHTLRDPKSVQHSFLESV